MPVGIPQAVWDSFKDEIYDLHFVRNMSLDEVIRIMGTKGLVAK